MQSKLVFNEISEIPLQVHEKIFQLFNEISVFWVIKQHSEWVKREAKEYASHVADISYPLECSGCNDF